MAKSKKKAGKKKKLKELSKADVERLRIAFDSHDIDPSDNLYGAGSLTWRINREAALLLGGGRALLLQLAHPLVAVGVAQHSDFRHDPLQRLWRTLDLMTTITFADAASAIRAVRRIEKAHSRVKGVLEEDVGPFPKGTAYDASDPELLLWVHATLVDTSLLVYQRFVDRLTLRERQTYYEESKRGGRILGVPPRLLPENLEDFEDYMSDMCRSDVLTVGRVGREVAAAVLWPRTPLGLRYVLAVPNLLTLDLLPRRIRERFGFQWSPERQLAARAFAWMSRRTIPWLPPVLRSMPGARGIA